MLANRRIAVGPGATMGFQPQRAAGSRHTATAANWQGAGLMGPSCSGNTAPMQPGLAPSLSLRRRLHVRPAQQQAASQAIGVGMAAAAPYTAQQQARLQGTCLAPGPRSRQPLAPSALGSGSSSMRTHALAIQVPAAAEHDPRAAASSPSTSTSTSAAASSTPVQVVDALIVGGGPAGLATALMLHKRGWKRIVVLEQQPSVTQADLTKSYVYGIDGRGRKALDMFGLGQAMLDEGVVWREMMAVPPQGPAKVSTLFITNPDHQMAFMPRSKFLELLMGAVEAAGPAIQVLSSSTCITFNRVGRDARAPIRVEAKVGLGTMVYEPTLLIGADGVQSTVRRRLHEWHPEGRFKMQKVPSAAAGLRIKVLQFPANPVAGSGDTQVTMNNQSAVIILGKKRLRMGMLPIKDASSPRTANIILRPDHAFWSINTPDKLLSHLEASFPQFPIRQLISKEQASAFISSSGTSFPRPQYCPTMQLLLRSDPEWTDEQATTSGSDPDIWSPVEYWKGAAASTGSASTSGSGSGGPNGNGHVSGRVGGPDRVQGVLLLGDAVHCFPPDLGQGVNSALEDIAVLDKALEECGDKLEAALPLYEQRRLPDIKALTRLMQFGYPYQYNQDQMGKALWTANFVLRLGLNKLLPWLVSPPAFMMVQDPKLSYSQVVARAEKTTKTLWTIVGALVLAALVILKLATGRII